MTGVMEVITLSSESEEDDSDVEIVAQYSNMSRADPLRHQEDAPNVTAPGVILQQRLMPRKPRPVNGLIAFSVGYCPYSCTILSREQNGGGF